MMMCQREENRFIIKSPPTLPFSKGGIFPSLKKRGTGRFSENYNRPAFPQAGFTLIELLIAITLTGVIVLIAAGAMRLGYRSADSGQAKVEALERYRISLGIIESQIQSALLVKQTGTTIDENFSQFKGDKTSLQFRSLYSVWGGSKGPVFVNYRIADEPGGGKSLFVSENPIAISDAVRETKLIENAKDIFLNYYYKGPTDEKGSWIEEWTDKDTVPQRIRMTIYKDNQVLPLIIPVRAAEQSQQITSVTGPK